MLRFDVAIDSDPGVQDDWLSVTHIQTFCRAVRDALARWDDPRVVRLVFFAARMIHHHRVLDLPENRRAKPSNDPIGLPAVLDAIATKDTSRAMGGASALLKDAADAESLRDAIMDLAVSDVFSQPIVGVHAMKNTIAAFDEHAATGDPRPVLAVVRLFASPLRQRWTYRTAKEAVNFVTRDEVPKLLAP